MVVALSLIGSSAAWAAPSATISAPTDTAITTTDDTTDITFSGSVSSGTTILYAAYGVFDSAGAPVVESLITGGTTFSTTVTLNATEAGETYDLLVGVLDVDASAVTTHTITVTKDAGPTCDPTDYECLAQVVLDTAEAEINTVLADALQDILDLLTPPFDQDDADAAWDIQDTAKNTAEAIESQAKDDANDIRDLASGSVKGEIASAIAHWQNVVKQALDDWNSQTDDIISDAEGTL
ncbi:hypothetical protein HOI71_13050 [Candidatus Poribacteria bacterium]|nr:hypothetical protein [Candidatus Poribacteria bacterium]MBT7098785.1 hypothetical protein [Candidatus Poribacteria bacterium]